MVGLFVALARKSYKFLIFVKLTSTLNHYFITELCRLKLSLDIQDAKSCLMMMKSKWVIPGENKSAQLNREADGFVYIYWLDKSLYVP